MKFYERPESGDTVLLPRGALFRWLANADELTAIGLQAALRRLETRPVMRHLSSALVAARFTAAVCSGRDKARAAQLVGEIQDAIDGAASDSMLVAALGTGRTRRR